ncbi:IcmF-related protein, partial [Rhodobacteraceae bacterium]|nr:IcmF-related protein [Paracoccaceae bacterium]
AQFLQRAMAISAAFFGDGQTFGADFEIAPLAERGDADVHLGGAIAPMVSTGQTLSWPGISPLKGMDVNFTQGGVSAQVSEPGLWGFLRLLDQTNIRTRDEGRRHLVDLRVDGGRLFFELTFATPINPLSVKSLLQGITCPPLL